MAQLKVKPNEQTASPLCAALKRTWLAFCASSSIHGLKYTQDRDTNKLVRYVSFEVYTYIFEFSHYKNAQDKLLKTQDPQVCIFQNLLKICIQKHYFIFFVFNLLKFFKPFSAFIIFTFFIFLYLKKCFLFFWNLFSVLSGCSLRWLCLSAQY